MKINKRKHTIVGAKYNHTKKARLAYQDSSPIKLLTPQMLLVGVFILALFIRLLYLKQIISTPLFHGLVVDAEEFNTVAVKLLRGDFTDQEVIYMNPLSPSSPLSFSSYVDTVISLLYSPRH